MTDAQDAPGWYPDPYEQAMESYWTGDRWEVGSRPRPTVSTRSHEAPAAPGATTVAPPRAILWPVVNMAAGAVMLLGSFLPWTTVTGTFGERASVAGTSGGLDGWISLGCGLIILAAGAVSLPRPRRLATVTADIGALAAAVLTVYEFSHITSESGVLGPANAVGIYDVSVGLGLAMVAVAAVVSLISAAGITGRDARAVLAS